MMRGAVYVVDDDPVQCELVRSALFETGLTVRLFGDPASFLAELASLSPGCIIAGQNRGTDRELVLQHDLLVRGCGFPVVALTAPDDVPAAVRAMKAGAADVVVRPVCAEELCIAVLGALATMTRAQEGRSTAQAVRVRLARLTRRERQVLEGMVRGEANKSIAYLLGISPRTVEVHRAKVMEKLTCRSLPDILRFALQAGLIAD